ncbi:hypothetical protein QQ008_10380 [Fulvivirgaceae bacterium BMA10]|uniref:Adhesin domain-containing protein n=1 Tax=Splendidivirga corallicola TaxID=3051826 RepID=A0ABT8KNH9_9BACT|nr:hypothetical protein [Fulvivirgaceae bacterium BMA10]
MKKTLILLIITAFGSVSLLGQEKKVERTFQARKGKKLDFNLKFARDIIIEGWSKNEVFFQAEVIINHGRNNDLHLLEFNNDPDRLNIESDFKKTDRDNFYFDCKGQHDEESYCTRINYKIKIPENANLSIESISGNIDVKQFSGALYAKTISGFVDLGWDQQRGADLSMKTVTGELYSDLEVNFTNRKKEAPMVGYNLRGLVAGGGNNIHLETISNDIFLRKN